jgi:protoporphyrinogen/coproporphyrinogen III oxidase
MDVLVVGGGIGGLALAHALAVRGADPLVLEASDRPGGVIRTEDLDGARVETGPQGFLGEHPGVLDVVEELALSRELVGASDEASRRYVLHRGRLVPIPLSPPALLTTPLLSIGGRLRVLGEPWARKAPSGPETVHAFATRRIGREAADVLVDAMVTGIFAGDPRQLSLEACFPKMVQLEREYGGLIRGMIARKRAARSAGTPSANGGAAGPAGARLHSFRSGMARLPEAYAAHLGKHVRTSAPVESLERDGAGWAVRLAGGERLSAARVAITTSARRSAALLDGVRPGAAAALREIVYAPVAVVGLLFPRVAVGHPLDGFGFLAPGGRRDLLGCLFESTIFPNRAPEGGVQLRAIVGGARRPDVVDRPEERIIEETVADLHGLLDITGPPSAARCWRHPRAIPQYDLAHPERLRRIRRELEECPGLVLAGASQRGVSVNRLVADGADLAERMLEGQRVA